MFVPEFLGRTLFSNAPFQWIKRIFFHRLVLWPIAAGVVGGVILSWIGIIINDTDVLAIGFILTIPFIAWVAFLAVLSLFLAIPRFLVICLAIFAIYFKLFGLVKQIVQSVSKDVNPLTAGSNEASSSLIRCLSFARYDQTNSAPFVKKINNPIWEDIKASVLRLDRNRYPWVWLFIGKSDEDPAVDCLAIVGCENLYWIALSSGNHSQLRLFDPNKNRKQVDLWVSDSGFSESEVYTTNDVELVLKIAKYYAETGEPLPGANWEVLL